MSAKAPTVEAYLSALKHARKAEIEDLRSAILAADKGIGEQVKWNAPSFLWKGDDRVTMRLQPGDRLELIFHRGAKAKPDKNFAFEDASGLIEWVTADRGVVRIADARALKANKAAIVKLVRTWMRATQG